MRITGWRGLGAFLLILATAPVYAAQCTSLSNGNWNWWLRWSCFHVPTSGDSVVVDHAITLDIDTDNLQGLTVNSGKSLIYSGNNRVINLGGPLVNNGTITVTGGTDGRVVLAANSTWSGSGSIALDYIDQNNKVLTLAVGSNLAIALSDATPLRNVPDSGFNSSSTPNRTATVVLNGGTQAIDSNHGIVYPNLTLTGGAKSHSGSTLKILGTLTIDSGATLNAVNAVELGGDLTINGTLSATGWGWTFNGSALQTISAAASFMQVAINNPQGITLGGNLTIGDTNTGDLSMLAGKINTGSFSVVIPRPCGAGWLSSRTAGSWINGNLQLTAPNYNASCFFPIGDADNFAPITFTYPWHNPPLGGTITGRTTGGDHPDTSLGLSGIDANKSVNRYWTLTRNTGDFYTFDTIFQYCNSSGTADCGVNDVDAAATPSGFVVAEKSGGAWTTSAPTSPTPASRQVSNVSSFGDFAIGQVGSGLTCLTDDFSKGLNTSLWNVAGSGYTPQVVTSPTVPTSRLRLTDNQSNRATFAQIKKWFPAANNRIVVEFDYYGWGGSGADGIAVVLSDASVPPSPGGYGGSMGYANRSGIDGFNGGWLGIGLDEFGNYPNSTENRRGYPAGYAPPAGASVPAGSYPSSVAVRGSGAGQTSGYALLANKGTLSPALTTTNATPHRYRIVMDHSNSMNAYVSVERKTGSGFTTVIPAFDVRVANSGQSPIPANMLLSFTGSTGGSTNNHEIGNVSICATHINNVGNSTPAASFECLESGTVSPWSTTARKPLYTKLTDTGFKFDIVALKSDGTIENGFVAAGGNPKDVTVELFDDSVSPSPNCSAYASPVGKQDLKYSSGDGGRKSITNDFNLNKAWSKLRCRVTDNKNGTPTVYGCSTDTFAVRPQSINSITSNNANADGTGASPGAVPIVRAGTAFSLTAGTGKAGYGGIPKIDTAKIEWPGMPGGGALGVLSGAFTTAADPVNGNGATGSAFAYSEVGYFRFLTQGVFDDTFTVLSSDAANSDCTNDFSNTAVGGKYGCKFGNTSASAYFGRFIPDHFVVTPGTTAPACSNAFSYFGQDGFTTPFALTAQNSANGTTKNYSGSYAKLDLTQYASYGFSASPLPAGSALSSSATPPSGTWINGIASVSAKHQISRPSALTGETAITVSAAPTDGEVPASAATAVGAASNFRYGRLWLGNAYGPENRALTLPYETQYWNGFAFVRNGLDNCTNLKTANVGLGNYQNAVTSANLPKTAISLGTFASGAGSLSLTAPNRSGSADIVVRLAPTATMCPPTWTPNYATTGTPTTADYLRASWCGTSSDRDPVARVTFGIATRNRQIYLRENY